MLYEQQIWQVYMCSYICKVNDSYMFIVDVTSALVLEKSVFGE